MAHPMPRRQLVLPFLFLALALAACGVQPQQEAPAAPEPAASPAALPAETPAPATPTLGAAAIPARFHGVWDNESANCDPASEQRIRIAANGIGFIESYGTVTRLTEAAGGKVTLDLAMEGEAMTWDATFTLETTGSGAGQRLLLLEPPGPDSAIMLRPIRFKRCPA